MIPQIFGIFLGKITCYKNNFIPLLVIAILLISCERDDICPGSTPTTPRLIIDMFDFTNQENSKNVFGLVVAGEDNEFVLPGFNIVTTNKLILPLKTDQNTTRYILIKEASINNNGTPDDTTDDTYNGNIDTITINYERKEVYVSRACGYKTIFENVTLNLDSSDTDPWILSQQPLNPNQSVENETTTHFNIFH